MKKWVGGVLVMVFFTGLTGISFALEANKTKAMEKETVTAVKSEVKNETKAAAKVEPKAVVPEAAVSAKDILKNQALEKATATLSSQEWTVYEMPAIGKRSTAMEEDTMIFKDGKISSKILQDRGYPESNFNLKMQDEYIAVFETMQVNENEGIAFIRGELNGSVLKGVISMQPKKGDKQAISFTSVKPEVVPMPQAQAPAPAKKKGKK